LKTSQP